MSCSPMRGHVRSIVKHFSIAMSREIVLGGELWLNASDPSNPSNGHNKGSVLFTIRSGSFTKSIQQTLVERVGLNQSTAIMEQCTSHVINAFNITHYHDLTIKYHSDSKGENEKIVVPSLERVAEFCQFSHFKELNPFICSYYIPWTSDELIRMRNEMRTKEKKWLRAAETHRKHLNATIGVPMWKKLHSVSNVNALIYPSSSSLSRGLFVIEGRSSIFHSKHALPNSSAVVMTNEHLVYANGRFDTCLITKPFTSDDHVVSILETDLVKNRMVAPADDDLSSRLKRAVTRMHSDLNDSGLPFSTEYDACRREVIERNYSTGTIIDGGCAILRNEFEQPILLSQPPISYYHQPLIVATDHLHRVQSLRISDSIDRCINKTARQLDNQWDWSMKNHAIAMTKNLIYIKKCFMPDYSKAELFTSLADIDYSTSHGKVLHNHALSELPPGRYAFVITVDNQISYGLIEDEWQIGVKHFQIATNRKVMLGGELWLNSPEGNSGSVYFKLPSDLNTFADNVGLNQSTAIMEQCTSVVIKALIMNDLTSTNYRYDPKTVQPHPLGSRGEDEKIVVERVAEFCQFPHFKGLNPFICSYYIPWTRDELIRMRNEMRTNEKNWLRAAETHRLHLNATMDVPVWKKLYSVSNASALVYPSSSSLPRGLFVIEGRSSIFHHKHTLPNSSAIIMTNEHLVFANGRLN